MSDALGSIDLDEEHVELLPTRILMSNMLVCLICKE